MSDGIPDSYSLIPFSLALDVGESGSADAHLSRMAKLVDAYAEAKVVIPSDFLAALLLSVCACHSIKPDICQQLLQGVPLLRTNGTVVADRLLVCIEGNLKTPRPARTRPSATEPIVEVPASSVQQIPTTCDSGVQTDEDQTEKGDTVSEVADASAAVPTQCEDRETQTDDKYEYRTETYRSRSPIRYVRVERDRDVGYHREYERGYSRADYEDRYYYRDDYYRDAPRRDGYRRDREYDSYYEPDGYRYRERDHSRSYQDECDQYGPYGEQGVVEEPREPEEIVDWGVPVPDKGEGGEGEAITENRVDEARFSTGWKSERPSWYDEPQYREPIPPASLSGEPCSPTDREGETVDGGEAQACDTPQPEVSEPVHVLGPDSERQGLLCKMQEDDAAQLQVGAGPAIPWLDVKDDGIADGTADVIGASTNPSE
ncbi:hypothetical protein KIPB_000201 [Kipferlia bialata]|uniref:Uncharacterized protein n=1 Tax=Kipferlia bialata TaxID=797122 RepID=A0A391NL52_9EUKA|nr:hypothetical protein KIPB_000201 [Kipferlia bialata]|eukprot:g201.t1